MQELANLGRLQPLHPVGVLARPDEDVRAHVEDEGVAVVHGGPRDVRQLPQDRLALPLNCMGNGVRGVS